MAEPPDLDRALVQEADEVLLAGNAPLTLDSAGDVWFVEEGTVEIFAVPRDGSGARTHLATAPPGRILCGTDVTGNGQGLAFLAVGPAGTRLRRLSLVRLRELARDPGIARDLSGRLDAWLAGLFGELSPAAAPKSFAELRPGAETLLETAGRTARAREGVVWVRHEEGGSHLLGEERLALLNGDLLPVPEGLWLVSAGESRIAALGTGDLLAGDGLGPGLARFHELCLDYVALRSERLEIEERERLGRKVNLDRSALSGAYARLASVLVPLPD